jgi:hypothetical protein
MLINVFDRVSRNKVGRFGEREYRPGQRRLEIASPPGVCPWKKPPSSAPRGWRLFACQAWKSRRSGPFEMVGVFPRGERPHHWVQPAPSWELKASPL